MKPGDRVICVNDDNLYHIPVRKICKGIVYTLAEVFTCTCGNVYVRLAEVNIPSYMWCPGCDTHQDCTMFFHIERFRLMEKSEASQEVHISEKAPAPVNIA